MAPPPPSELVLDVVDHILLRIPPDDPAHLFRASLVCKPWRRLLTDPAFLRRYRAFHRKPPLLGFLRNTYHTARFIPTSRFRPQYPESDSCRVLDCRHGRVLLFDYTISARRLIVWDPITGEDHHIPRDIDIFAMSSYNAAVLCAATDCDHLTCYGGPFLVVLTAVDLYFDEDGDEIFTCAWVYSSEAGKWSRPTNLMSDYTIMRCPPVLTGDKIYFACEYARRILCYDLNDNGGLTLINGPRPDINIYGSYALIPAEDGGLRFAGLQSCMLGLWSLEMMEPDGVPSWKRRCIIKLHQLLTVTDSMSLPRLIGCANGPVGDVVYVTTDARVFTVELESHKITKVDDIDFGDRDTPIFPYTSFLTPECAVGRLSLPLQ